MQLEIHNDIIIIHDEYGLSATFLRNEIDISYYFETAIQVINLSPEETLDNSYVTIIVRKSW